MISLAEPCSVAPMKINKDTQRVRLIGIGLAVAACAAVAVLALAGGQPRVGYPESTTSGYGVDTGTSAYIVER